MKVVYNLWFNYENVYKKLPKEIFPSEGDSKLFWIKLAFNISFGLAYHSLMYPKQIMHEFIEKNIHLIFLYFYFIKIKRQITKKMRTCYVPRTFPTWCCSFPGPSSISFVASSSSIVIEFLNLLFSLLNFLLVHRLVFELKFISTSMATFIAAVYQMIDWQ